MCVASTRSRGEASKPISALAQSCGRREPTPPQGNDCGEGKYGGDLIEDGDKPRHDANSFCEIYERNGAGVGLPLVALPLLTMVVSVKTAVGLLVAPIIATNFAQSFEGGRFVSTLRRFWPVIACLVVAIVVGVNAPVLIGERALYAVMGASIIVFPLAAQIWPRLRVKPAHERWVGPLVGAIAGLVGRASSLYGPPLFLYLAALRLAMEEFVPAISMLFLTGTLGATHRAFVVSNSCPWRSGAVGCRGDPGLRRASARSKDPAAAASAPFRPGTVASLSHDRI